MSRWSRHPPSAGPRLVRFRAHRPEMLDPAHHPRLLVSLAAATRADPLGRKVLVAERAADGRELLRALALAGVPWIGWEPATLRTLAGEIAGPALAAEGVALADDFDLLAAADRAIDAVTAPAAARREGAGVRGAVRSALASLRRAGIGPSVLRAVHPGDRRLAALAAALEAYADELARAERVDGPGLMGRAVDALGSGSVAPPEASIHLLPGLPLRGVAGRFVRHLVERGATVLEADPVPGIDPPPGMLWAAGPPAPPIPPVQLFASATPDDELREALRRALAEEDGWDRVEIVATDPAAYGAALHSTHLRLEAVDGVGVPATFAEGVDVRRARPGRALESYLRWIDEGYPAERLRAMLDAEEVAPPRRWRRVSGHALAAALRRLQIAGGRERYLPAIDAARHALAYAPEELIVTASGVGDPNGASTRAGEVLDALRALVARLLALAPAGPEPRGADGARTSPAALAAGALALLEAVPEGNAADEAARVALQMRLLRAREALTRETGWDAALAELRARLDVRASPAADGEGGRTSEGGRVHLSGTRSGGFACRARTFVVGPGAGGEGASGPRDPLLTDVLRGRVNARAGHPVPPLATAPERTAEARFRRAALLARLRGAVTLSCAVGNVGSGHAASPGPELLQALRRREGEDALGYDALRVALGPPVGAVPSDGRMLDGRDVWLAAVAEDGAEPVRAAVRAAFPGLDRGAAAAGARAGARATAYHGVVARRTGTTARAAFSASSLETLGRCPRRYFYRAVLGAEPVEETVRRRDAWLSPALRGTLLHRVYERTLREAAQEDAAISSPAFAALAEEILDAEAARAARRDPPPSDAVAAAELDALRDDVACWVRMVRADAPRWVHLEYRFEPTDDDTDAGPTPLRGVIDRVDETAPRGLRVVDYKTGRADGYRPSRPLDGGRRVQHLVYAVAVRRHLGREAESCEFHFPTRAGRNERVRLPLPPAEEAEALLSKMAALAAEGPYLPTDDAADCRFCAYAPVCRATTDPHGGTSSPPAAWMKQVGVHLPEGRWVRWLRSLDG